jgi:fumarate reductase subunit C
MTLRAELEPHMEFPDHVHLYTILCQLQIMLVNEYILPTTYFKNMPQIVSVFVREKVTQVSDMVFGLLACHVITY